jgi:virulence factor Mce-like protein
LRSRWNLLIVLVYMGIAGGVLSYMAVNMIGPCRPFAGCMSLNVEFKNASGLLHSNDLRMAGVKAGQVTTIRNQGGMAVVGIQVQPEYKPIYRDAHAIVRPKNLLGETYVEIDRGNSSAGEFREGDTIALDHTITPVQVDEVLNALDPDTRTKLQIVINSLGEATAARGKDLNLSAGDLKRISADLAVTSTSLNQEKDNIDALLVQLDLIQQTAADDHQQLAQTLQDWNTVSITMQKKAATFADAIGHINHVLGVLDQGLSPNANGLHSGVAQLPSAINDAAINTPGGQVCSTYGCSPSPNGGFLGISSTIQEFFIKKPAGCTAGPCGNTLQDGIALFPRLAQTMLGVNTCDMHIYANGYYNVPGVTEPGSPTCQSPVDANGNAADPNLTGEVFGDFSPNTGKAGNRHMWRVMGMIDLGKAGCGFFSPSTTQQNASSCYPGDNGLSQYGGTPTSAAQPNSSTASGSGSGGFLQDLLGTIWGGGGA